MVERSLLAEAFETHRSRLRLVAYRMLGSSDEAEDAVQEAWLRLSRADASGVDNLGGWLTTVVGRICLDALRARRVRPEVSLEEHMFGAAESTGPTTDPEQEALLADSVGLALLVVLDKLTPAERLAFVLHDMFDVPFSEIASILERSPAAAKMLASRARRRIRTADVDANADDDDLAKRRKVVRAFLAASRAGDFEALVGLLHPDVVLRADNATVQLGATPELRGAQAVIDQLAGRAQAARPALVNGAPGAVWAPGGQLRVVMDFTIAGDQIVAIDLIADPERLDHLELVTLRNVRRTDH